ncbi:MAG TPA: polymer-forming cytoskeletal protein [Candidatus Binatia bacterium]|nr:polymer-forming cytoskeletal protein [Candidatus Binatia bacterium]
MALFGKDGERSERARGLGPEPAAALSGLGPGEAGMLVRDTPGTRPEQGGGADAFLGQGSQVTGKLVFKGPVRIEGQVEGEITAQDALTIGESAVVNAQVTGTSIVIEGRVTGDVTARRKLEIRASGRLFGGIVTPSLVIQQGGIFEGHCAMSATESQRADRDRERKVALVPREERPGEAPVTPE